MRFVKTLIAAAAIVAFVPGVASAQEQRVHFSLGVGPTFMLGDQSDRFNTGYGPTVGLTFDANDRVGFRVEYDYNRFNAKNYVDILGGQYTANHQTNDISFDLVLNLTKSDAKARVYIVAGPDVNYRKIQVTQYVGTGIVCDPYFYICGTYPITAIVGSRGGWDFGFNAGAGVGFKMGETAEFTIETRYVWAQGPEVTPPAGSTFKGGKANGAYVPLIFGFRW